MGNKMKAIERQYCQLIDNLTSQVRNIELTLELMPRRGNSSSTCQKINLLNHIKEFEQCVNGIVLYDLMPNDYSGDFKLSYSGD